MRPRRRPGPAGRRTTVALLPQAGTRLNKAALSGKVDVRVRVNDPQTFIGWFRRSRTSPRRTIRSGCR